MFRGEVETDSGTLFIGGSRMARLVREFDWGRTPWGPWSQWPPELKTVVLYRGLGRSSALDRRFIPQGFEFDLALPVSEL